MKRTIAVLFAAAQLGASLQADASSISIDSVVQRWPWNNKIDITYTVSEGQDVSLGVFAKIVFTAVIDGKTYTIDGVHDVGASASDGTHTVTWTPPASLSVKATDCTMTATLSAADAPSGDDYMVVDLASGAISYEGLLATQDDSNARYNTDEYKQDKLVLRKIPMGAYQVGHANITTTNHKNTPKIWDLSKFNDGATYYIGVFPVTQAQYQKIYGSNPSGCTAHYEPDKDSTHELNADDTIANRPVEKVSWNGLRGSDGTSYPLGTLAPSANGTFLQRLNNLAGVAADGYGFDLPTEIMHEIAARAGATTAYWWGDSVVEEKQPDGLYYSATKTNAGSNSFAVGLTKPNPWGLYDTAANVGNWCADTWGLDDLEDAESPYVAHLQADAANARNRATSGWYYNKYMSASNRAGWAGTRYTGRTLINTGIGFRVAKLAR